MKKSDIGNVEKYGRFSIALKYFLIKNNLTQGELARSTGISEATISHYMKGKSTPSQSRLEKIAECLGVSPHDFYSMTDEVLSMPPSKFGERLNRILHKGNITQEDFAKAIGVSRQTVNTYINGKRFPMDNVLDRIVKFLGVPIDALTSDDADDADDDGMKIKVFKMPSSKKSCLFSTESIMEGAYECSFGGICNLCGKYCKCLTE